MFKRDQEKKKSKFKKCSKCGTETVLAICSNCKTPLIKTVSKSVGEESKKERRSRLRKERRQKRYAKS